MSYDIVGVGIASLDLIGIAASEPQLGAKQPLAGWVEMGGGPAATAMAAVARLGGRAALVSAVGDDVYGPRIVADLVAAGVDVGGVQVRPGGSHVSFVLAEPGRDRRTVWWHNDRAVLDGLALDRSRLTAARGLLIDTHIPDAALAAARWMREAGRPVMIDAERVRESTMALLPHCDLLVVSERFAREATGLDDPGAGAQALHRGYGRLALVTCGAAGSWCAHEGELFHTPAFPVEPIDTTGAGDVFHGALLYALVQGRAVREAIGYASAAAALSCTGLGGRGNLPTAGEVEALLAAGQA